MNYHWLFYKEFSLINKMNLQRKHAGSVFSFLYKLTNLAVNIFWFCILTTTKNEQCVHAYLCCVCVCMCTCMCACMYGMCTVYVCVCECACACFILSQVVPALSVAQGIGVHISFMSNCVCFIKFYWQMRLLIRSKWWFFLQVLEIFTLQFWCLSITLVIGNILTIFIWGFL